MKHARQKKRRENNSGCRLSTCFFSAIIVFVSAKLYFPALTYSGNESYFINSFDEYVYPKHRNAFVSLLCDEGTLQATMVLFHSLKKTNSSHDLVVITSNITRDKTYALSLLGVKVVVVQDPTFLSGRHETDTNTNTCRHFKLLLWNMSEYHKVVYMDSDMLVLQNIDRLFDFPSLSATPHWNVPDRFSTRLMVLQPSASLFASMAEQLAANPETDDDIFLNNWFSDWYAHSRSQSIDFSYSFPSCQFTSPAWNQLVASKSKVVHFSGPAKPWNLDIHDQFPANPKMVNLWLEMYDEVGALLRQAASREGNSDGFIFLEKQTRECSRDFMAYQRGALVEGKLSVIINSFDRWAMLKHMVGQYSRLDFVHKIYVVWGNSQVRPHGPSFFNVTTPLEVIYTGLDNLNDRFKPIESLQTEAVLVCDDDIQASPDALRLAFERWQESKHRLVGFFPRAHYVNAQTGRLVYVLRPSGTHSMVLTKMMLMHAQYLQRYSCQLPTPLLEYVDSIKNCEDILMNMLVTRLSHLPPLYVSDDTKLDYGTLSGLSSRLSHDGSRSSCMNEIVGLLGYMSLRNTTDAVLHHDSLLDRRLTRQSHSASFTSVINRRKVFMDALPYVSSRYGTDAAYVPFNSDESDSTLCVKNETRRTACSTPVDGYGIVQYKTMEGNFSFLHGTTFIAYSVLDFEGRFNFLRLVATLFHWRTVHGCFSPSNVYIINSRSCAARLDLWSRALIKVSMGESVQLSRVKDLLPACFESAVVLRASSHDMASGGCHPSMPLVRAAVVSLCKSAVRDSEQEERRLHGAVHVVFVGDMANNSMFSYFSLRSRILRKCQASNLNCRVSGMSGGTFCKDQVLPMNRADVAVGFWKDRLMDNIIFLNPGSSVIEIIPYLINRLKTSLAHNVTGCLGLLYQQVKRSHGVNHLFDQIWHQVKKARPRNYSKDSVRYNDSLCTQRGLAM